MLVFCHAQGPGFDPQHHKQPCPHLEPSPELLTFIAGRAVHIFVTRGRLTPPGPESELFLLDQVAEGLLTLWTLYVTIRAQRKTHLHPEDLKLQGTIEWTPCVCCPTSAQSSFLEMFYYFTLVSEVNA